MDHVELPDNIKPYVDDDSVPRCASGCPSFTRHLKKDGTPSQNRGWYCAIDEKDHGGRVCIPAVQLLAKALKASKTETPDLAAAHAAGIAEGHKRWLHVLDTQVNERAAARVFGPLTAEAAEVAQRLRYAIDVARERGAEDAEYEASKMLTADDAKKDMVKHLHKKIVRTDRAAAFAEGDERARLEGQKHALEALSESGTFFGLLERD